MTKEEKREEIENIQYQANEAKTRLMNLMDDLENIGAIRKAKSLGTIIEKLERWQNT